MPLVIAPNPLDEALVDLLEADVTDPLADPPDGLAGARFMDLCPGGANHLVAPEGVAQPYMVFGLTQPTRDTYTMTGLAFQDCLYGFDVIQEGHSAEQAQSAARRLWALLQDADGTLTPTGWAVMHCRRTGYQERLERAEGGVLYQHVQSLFAITIRPVPGD